MTTTSDGGWYSRSPADVAQALGVDPAVGLSAATAAERLRANGPNALPEEQPKPGWLRFLEEYRSYMQIILLAAAVVSLLIAEWGTAVLLLVLTVLNAVIGLRQEGKAESAMNALKSMLKATARVRRDGDAAEIPAEQLVVGDVVLLSAGDQVPADGRIVAASSLQIDESALTGESVPAAKDARSPEGSGLGPGDQTDMAFMNTPVTHGSGTMIVTGTGRGHRAREDLGDALGQGQGEDAAHRGARPAHPLDRRRGRTHDDRDVRARPLPRRGLGRAVRQRRRPGDRRRPRGAAHGDADDPLARRGGPGQAQRHRQGAAVGRDARLHVGDQLGQDRHPDDEPDDGRRGRGSPATATPSPARATAWRARIHHAAGTSPSIEAAILPYVVASDAQLVDGRVVGDPTEGALLVLGHKAGLDIDATRERLPRLATLPFDPTDQAHGDVPRDHRRGRAAGRPVLREGRGAGGDGAGGHRAVRGRLRPVGRRAAGAGGRAHGADGASRADGSWPRPCAISTRPSSTRTATCSAT